MGVKSYFSAVHNQNIDRCINTTNFLLNLKRVNRAVIYYTPINQRGNQNWTFQRERLKGAARFGLFCCGSLETWLRCRCEINPRLRTSHSEYKIRHDRPWDFKDLIVMPECRIDWEHQWTEYNKRLSSWCLYLQHFLKNSIGMLVNLQPWGWFHVALSITYLFQ